MQKRTNLVILIIGLLIVFALGFGIGKSAFPEPKMTEMTESQLTSDLEEKLASKIERGLIFLDPLYGEKRVINSLSGEVIEAGENIITVKAVNSYRGGRLFDYLNEPDYYEKTVKVEKDTEIVKLIFEEILEEIPFLLMEPPLPEEKEASFLELKVGTRVFIEAKAEFDLAGTDEISAKRIEIHE